MPLPTPPPRGPLVTDRDMEILAALALTPLTVEQLLKLSATFATPFTDARRVRERMRVLVESRRVNRFLYATAGVGSPAYFTLSPLGFRILNGPEAILPGKRSFGEVGIARQRHTQRLADFTVHLLASAHREKIEVRNFARENGVKLAVGAEFLYPDGAFQLRVPDGRILNFYVELDNRSERLRSDGDADSLERKIRIYELHADSSDSRFRVLLVATGGSERLNHVLAMAKDLALNPQRSLVYATLLPEYLAASEAVTAPVFRNHFGQPVPLIALKSVPFGKPDASSKALRIGYDSGPLSPKPPPARGV